MSYPIAQIVHSGIAINGLDPYPSFNITPLYTDSALVGLVGTWAGSLENPIPQFSQGGSPVGIDIGSFSTPGPAGAYTGIGAIRSYPAGVIVCDPGLPGSWIAAAFTVIEIQKVNSLGDPNIVGDTNATFTIPTQNQADMFCSVFFGVGDASGVAPTIDHGTIAYADANTSSGAGVYYGCAYESIPVSAPLSRTYNTGTPVDCSVSGQGFYFAAETVYFPFNRTANILVPTNMLTMPSFTHPGIPTALPGPGLFPGSAYKQQRYWGQDVLFLSMFPGHQPVVVDALPPVPTGDYPQRPSNSYWGQDILLLEDPSIIPPPHPPLPGRVVDPRKQFKYPRIHAGKR